jgi:alpha-L-rhamnosidase
LQVHPDFDYTKPQSDSHLEFLHRKLSDADIYFVDNRNDHDESLEATFRVAGREPELWYAETGKSQPTSYKIAGGLTTVPLHLEAWGTVFVVFRKAAAKPRVTLPSAHETPLTTVEGSWNVAFQPDLGAPPATTLDTLASWSENSSDGIKYYSGSGTYTKTIQAPADWFKPGTKVWLDLGNVQNLAEVTVNGTPLGIVWHAPFRVDATGALKPGPNALTIKVTNAWVNRLIGDQQPGATKYTYADVTPYKAKSPLLPSGLLGPVTLIRVSSN